MAATQTRERFLAVARDHFADRGFEAASIAAIASEVGFTKQALLHHFRSKEKLYGEVLEGIAERFLKDVLATEAVSDDPCDQLEALLLGRREDRAQGSPDGRLIARELLDNAGRAEHAGNWYLKPYLEALVEIVLRTPGGRDLRPEEALAVVYQLIGAVSYFAISQATLRNMFGAQSFDVVAGAFEGQFRSLLRARLGGLRPATRP